MRLGGHFHHAGSIAELDKLCYDMDTHGLGCISAPGMDNMTDDEIVAFGEEARKRDIVIGETGMWGNLMTADKDNQASRIAATRELLVKSDLMGCHSVVTLVGSRHPSDHGLAMHPYMKTQDAKDEFYEVVNRILDGLDLKTTKYIIEPWHNTFFYKPEDIREFIDRVDHPAFGLHLDQMNMVSQEDFFDTGKLIDTTFDLLADKVFSVHLKDIREDFTHMFLKWDEVYIGDGVMDYDRYLKRLAELPEDLPCYCEHMSEEMEFALCFVRLHKLAADAGVAFKHRAQ